MSPRAWVYVWLILLSGLGLTCWTGFSLPASELRLDPFAQLTILATLAQLFKVEAPGRQTYYTSLIFVFASWVLLPPFLFILVVAISSVIEWIKERLTHSPLFRDWYIQPFNISTVVIAGVAAYGFYALPWNRLVLPFGIPGWFPAVLLAAVLFVLLNHFLVGLALVIARGISFHQSGIFQFENLMSDLILLYIGFAVAFLWNDHFWLIPLVLSPLVLMYRALKIPLLKHEAQTDGKTGLWNAHYFMEMFNAELNRAKRFNHPLSFLMADLDLLRNINNTYGHLAGDAVLVGIGKIIREEVREYDLAARFGGEEFSLALPETGLEEARKIAERLRRIIETTDFNIPTRSHPIHATISFGVACFPTDASTPLELIHNADLAVYQAKLNGRNRTVAAPEVSDSLRQELASESGHLASTYAELARSPQ